MADDNLIITDDRLVVLRQHPITVLLVDDQKIIAEAVKRMLAGEDDIVFHYCEEPVNAVAMAEAVGATVILQDLVMPEIDGLTLVRYYRANPATRFLPLIVLSTTEDPKVKAQAFAVGADDYIVKLPDRVELLARIRYHSRGYTRLLERNEAYRKLVESQAALNAELAQAADYVISLLPAPVDNGVTTCWKFVPSTSLGGDSFGYHWLDDDTFAIYLLDVCGHGVGAALLSISVMNLLRSQRLAHADFYDPASVLAALNDAFPMEQQNNMFFTMWYGIYNKKTRMLTFSSGGHPPAVLVTGEGAAVTVEELSTSGLVIGGMAGVTFQKASVAVGEHNRFYVFSDGVFEVDKPDGTMLQMREFIDVLVNEHDDAVPDTERMFLFAKSLHGQGPLDDDFSLVKVIFH